MTYSLTFSCRKYTTELWRKRSTIDMVFCGGSMRVVGSQILGGSTVKSSMNSSMPSNKWSAVLATYATSQNIYNVVYRLYVVWSVMCRSHKSNFQRRLFREVPSATASYRLQHLKNSQETSKLKTTVGPRNHIFNCCIRSINPIYHKPTTILKLQVCKLQVI